MSDPSPTDPQSSWTDSADAPTRAQASGDPYASGAAWTHQPPEPGAIPPIQIRPSPPRVVVYLLAMVGAVAWFVAGLATDRIYFYPPVLFVVGFLALVKGLVGTQAPRPVAGTLRTGR